MRSPGPQARALFLRRLEETAASASLSDYDRLVAQIGVDCAEELPAMHRALLGLPAGSTFDAAAAPLPGRPRSGRRAGPSSRRAQGEGRGCDAPALAHAAGGSLRAIRREHSPRRGTPAALDLPHRGGHSPAPGTVSPMIDPDRPTGATDACASPPRQHCVVGDTLCEVRVLTEAQWKALPADRRPSPAEHVPGLGWVVAVLPGRSALKGYH